MAGVVVIGANLMFASKVLEAARALGIDAQSAAPDSEPAGVALVLLDVEKLSVEQIGEIRGRTSARIIGFASHVAVEAIAAAREAGCDEVLSRGQFTAQLPQLLAALKAS